LGGELPILLYIILGGRVIATFSLLKNRRLYIGDIGSGWESYKPYGTPELEKKRKEKKEMESLVENQRAGNLI
jgi:hypothetical protein